MARVEGMGSGIPLEPVGNGEEFEVEWSAKLSELPDAIIELSPAAHLVGTCDPPCGGPLCGPPR
jgi:hypothetical protein